MSYGWRALLDFAISQLGLSAVGRQTPGTTYGGKHSVGSWHFKDSCAPERPGSAGGTDGCAIDFGMGGANLKSLVALYLRPEVSKHIPEMIYEHSYWRYGKARNYAPHDHCSHGGNLHLHVAVDPCVPLVSQPKPKPRPKPKELTDMAFRGSHHGVAYVFSGPFRRRIQSDAINRALSRAEIPLPDGTVVPAFPALRLDGGSAVQDDVFGQFVDLDEFMDLLRKATRN